MDKRVFLIVLDSFGIGEMPDAADFGDTGSNTLAAIAQSGQFAVPNLQKLGLFNIDGVRCGEKAAHPLASFARLEERSKGKDTTIGHWEIAGVVSPKALPVFPNGFPQDLLNALKAKTGRDVLCNMPYSGTDVLRDFGEEHMRTGAMIVYTSADSVFQVAAHEDIVPVDALYAYCEAARELLAGPYAVGRVIARPFIGTNAADFKRTTNRHDISLPPPRATMLDYLQTAGKATIGVGKIYDIFAGQGVSEKIKTAGNVHGMEETIRLATRDFNGLAFINLVDFDMIYGHRNDIDGYAAAMTQFDKQLGALLPLLQPDDLLMITADHGCDPATPSTDHSREYVPLLLYGKQCKQGVNLASISGFACIAATVCDYLGVKAELDGESLLKYL